MPDPDDLLELIGDLYRAASDEDHWPQALRRLSESFDNSGIFILTLDHGSGEIPHAVSYDLPPAGVLEYRTRFARLDPLTHYAIANPRRDRMDDQECVSNAKRDHDEFYSWLQHTMGYRYRLKVKLFEAGHLHTYASLKRTREQGPWDRETAALFLDRVTPHLSRAVRLSLDLGNLKSHQTALCDAGDRLPYGILLLGANGRVVRKNREAGEILRAADGLHAEKGLLRAHLSKVDNILQDALRGVLDQASGNDDPGAALSIPRPSGKRAYALRIAPLTLPSSLFVTDHPRAAVFVTDPERPHDTPLEHLTQTYDFTPREAQLAALLATGSTLELAAERLEITRGTARVHLERIFKKTGVRRQVELVRLLLGSPLFLD